MWDSGLGGRAPTCTGQLSPQLAHVVQQLLQALLAVLPIGQELLQDLVHLSLHARTLFHGGLCLWVGGVHCVRPHLGWGGTVGVLPYPPSPHPCHLLMLRNSQLCMCVHSAHHPSQGAPWRVQAGMRMGFLNHGDKITVFNSFHSVILVHLFLIRRKSRPHRAFSRRYTLLEIHTYAAYFPISCIFMCSL